MSELTRRQFIGTAAGLVLTSTVCALPARAIAINPRSAWATDRPPKGPVPEEEVRFLLVHHTASRNGHTGSDAPGILRAIFDFHTGPEKGWNDIAYNFLIDSEGGIWEGRAGSLAGPVAGDATGGNQGFSQLVCLIGDYNTAQPTEESLASLVTTLAWLGDRYGVDTSQGSNVTFVSRGSNRWPAGTEVTTPTITGHRTMSQTTCPGSNLYAYVAGDLMADVTRARAGVVVTPSAPVPTSTSTTTPSTSSTSASPAASSTASTAATPSTVAEPIGADLAQTTVATTRPLPTAAPSSIVPAVAAPIPSTPTTVAPPMRPSPLGSPLVGAAAVGAILATMLVAWRARRMRNR